MRFIYDAELIRGMFRYLENKSTQNRLLYMCIVYCCGYMKSKKRVSELYYTCVSTYVVRSLYLYIHGTVDLGCIYSKGLFCTRNEQFSYSNILNSVNNTL